MLYTNLGNFKVEMPYNYVNTGGGREGGLMNNLDLISAFSALGLKPGFRASRASGIGSAGGTAATVKTPREIKSA